jgi:hypothetical protein
MLVERVFALAALVGACHPPTDARPLKNQATEDTGSVTGIVTTDGKPLANTAVVIETRGQFEPEQLVAETGADGRFAIANVPVGEHAVQAIADRTAFVDDARAVVTVAAGKAVDVALEMHIGTIDLTVSAQTTPPPALHELMLSDAFLFRGPTVVRTVYEVYNEYGYMPALRGYNMSLDEGAMAIFHGIPPGNYTLCLSAARHPGPDTPTPEQWRKLIQDTALACRSVTVQPKGELEVQAQELDIAVPRDK